MCTVYYRKSTFAVTVQWTVTALLQNKTREKKKKKKKKTETQEQETQRNLSRTQTHTTKIENTHNKDFSICVSQNIQQLP